MESVEVGALRNIVNRVVFDSPSPSLGISPKPGSTVTISATGNPVDSPTGHRVDSSHWGYLYGLVYTHTHLLVTGMLIRPIPNYIYLFRIHTSRLGVLVVGMDLILSLILLGRSSSSKLSKMNFPIFNGDNPKLWISHRYFHVGQSCFDEFLYCGCPLVAVHRGESQKGIVARSLHDDFRVFGKDQHALFIRQLFHIRQTSTVSKYVDSFFELVDSLVAYESGADSLYFFYSLR